jgi:hypothetical protein
MPSQRQKQKPSQRQREEYITGYLEALRAKKLPEPSMYQCEDCNLESDDEVGDEDKPGPEHVVDHVLHDEHVSGLIVCALSEANAPVEMFHAINELWQDADDDIVYSTREEVWDTMEAALRGYIDRKLGE